MVHYVTLIHVNVPPVGERQWKVYRRRTLWAVAAILAPEYAIWAAYEQLHAAQRLKRELEQQPNNADRFGLTYCFYVVMGGFAVDVDAIHDTSKYMTITPDGLVLLAQRGHFITLDKRTIQDRSKADVLAKTLVCVQVAWLIIQSIGRAANGLPIALLEVHVLAHVACALLLYAIWLKKPFNVMEATLVDDSIEFAQVLALMLVLNERGPKNDEFFENRQMADSSSAAEKPKSSAIDHDSSTTEPEPPKSGRSLGSVYSSTPKDRERWSRAREAKKNGMPPYPQPFYLSERAKESNIWDLLMSDHAKPPPVIGLIISLAAAYAGIHLGAWGYHFPTEAEMWLWRGSGLVIAGIGPGYLTLLLITAAVRHIIKDKWQCKSPFIDALGWIVFFGRLLLFAFLSVAARLFLLIEAFASVREMPIGVFVTMQWSDYIPHI
ncbi:hypothetical protein NUW58_g3190 [Xylaria curta]|uniref:Uncharacterized protein n=1 Tax=Xylaria curta TaxID=42375 RepID=A0ACC1PC17_9PEZI|nr:hypothetical protein NUW58_g3190 [Xylaria curta]